MGRPDKMKTLGTGGFESLIRLNHQRDMMGMSEEDLRAMLVEAKLPQEGTKEELVERLLDNGFTTEDDNSPETGSEEKVVVEEAAPTEGTFDVVHSPTIEEENKLKKEIADLLAAKKYSQVYKDPKRLEFFQKFETEIDELVSVERANGTGKKENLNGRRRKTDNDPFPQPAPKPVVKKEAVQPTPKIIEAVKPAAVLPATPSERFKPLHQDQLGQAPRPEPKPELDTEKEMNRVARKIFEAKEELTPAEHAFRGNHPEISRLVWQLHEEQGAGSTRPPVETVKPVAILDKERPSAKLEPEKVLADANKDSAKENQKPTIDGLVSFNLGKLGIKEEDITREVPNFLSLSPEQQNYVLGKLRQKVGHDLDQNVKEELSKTKGIKRFFNGFRAGGIRSRMAKETKEGGISSYKENLKDITDFVKNRDLGVEVTEKGMVLKFLSSEGKVGPHKEMIREFNRRATMLAEIPYDKTLDDRTPLQILQKKKYDKAKKAFEEIRMRLIDREIGDESVQDKNAIILQLSNVGDDIRMNQALTYNQEATSWIGQKMQKWGVAEKGVIGATGFAARGLAKYAAGFGGGLVASAVLGGAMGRLRKGQEFQRVASDKRYGEFVKAEKGAEGPVKEKRAGVKEFIDSRGYAERINKLIEKIENTSPGEKRDALLQSLENRTTIARERDEAGLVRFGNTKDELKNKFIFIDALKRATEIERESKVIWEAEKVAERLNNIYFKDNEKTAAREKEMKKAFWRGARNGALIFIGGFEANDLLFHNGEATKEAINKIAEMNNGMKGVVGLPPDKLPFTNPETVRLNPTPVTAGQPANFPENLPHGASEIVPPPPISVAESSIGSRGFIGGIRDLQRALTAQYGDNVPDNLKEFVNGNADRIAIKWGGYIPGQENESIALPHGSGFVAHPDGNVSLKLPDGKLVSMTNVTEKMQFDYFDSGAREAAPALPDNLDHNIASAPDANTAYNPEGFAGTPEGVPGAQRIDFNKVTDFFEDRGFRHEAVEGGDIFSAEVHPDAEAPEAIEDYRELDGQAVDSKELKGTINFLEDSRGNIKSVDLGALKVEDISRFRANPQNFIGGNHDVAERALLGKKLLAMRSEVETFLAYRKILQLEDIDPGSDQYKFLNSESNRLWSAIQKKVEYQFTPQYSGVDGNPIDNTAPFVSVPSEELVSPTADIAPVPSESAPNVGNLGEGDIATPEDLERERALEEAHNEGGLHDDAASREIIRTTNDVIPSGNEMFSSETITKYGPVERSGNVAFFEKGYVGFYGESGNMSVAEGKTRISAEKNMHLIESAAALGRGVKELPVEIIRVIKNGDYQILRIYKIVKE